MADTQHYNLRTSRFALDLRFGCVQIRNAGKLPLEFATHIVKPGQIGLTLVGATGKPGSSDSTVWISAYRFRDGLDAFEIDVDWWGKERKTRAKLPDDVNFDDSVLAASDAPANWEHDAYPQSNRKFVHVYKGPNEGVIIRWLARTGTILDHPLFIPLAANLRIIPGQWITKAPTIEPTSGQQSAVKETPLPADVQSDLDKAAECARIALQLKRVRKPKRVAEAIYHAIDELRERKGAKSSEKKRFAIECGALWGQVLCEATGWKWKRLQGESGDGSPAVCSPDGAHAVLPLNVIHGIVMNRRVANNSLLLFNMITSGKFPPPIKGSRTMLN
jgi:hypothetical protein